MTAPIIRPYGGHGMQSVFTYKFKCKISGESYNIEQGFVFDGASIPRVFWSILGSPFTPKHIRAALEHDYLIKVNANGRDRDLHFYARLLEDSVSPWKAKLMYLGVVVWRKLKK